jgi:plastocyanin
MMKRISILLFATSMSATALSAPAAEYMVDQKNKAFNVKALKAKVGDKIVFHNDDSFAHNIFSLSDTQSFDLGSYGKGDSRAVVLNKEGKLDVECAIHPEMKMVVEVTK